MTDNNEQEHKRPLSLGGRASGRLELRKPIETSQVRQSFPHGRTKTVMVEVRKKRTVVPGLGERSEAPAAPRETPPAAAPEAKRAPLVMPRTLTADERAGRVRALQDAQKAHEEPRAHAAAAPGSTPRRPMRRRAGKRSSRSTGSARKRPSVLPRMRGGGPRRRRGGPRKRRGARPRRRRSAAPRRIRSARRRKNSAARWPSAPAKPLPPKSRP